jgi:transposase
LPQSKQRIDPPPGNFCFMSLSHTDLVAQDPACERLMTVPGIGPIISSATVAAIGTGDVFSKGRDFAAWLGLVPRQISTGDRTILGKISKRGNRYLRVLFGQCKDASIARPLLINFGHPAGAGSHLVNPASRML